MSAMQAWRWCRGVFRSVWLRGFLPSVLIAISIVLSLRFGVALQWDTATGAGGTAKRIVVARGQVGVAWGPGTGAAAGETVLGQFMRDGVMFWRSNTWLTVARWWPRVLPKQVFVPLWIVAGALAIPPALFAMRRRIRAISNLCYKCGYSRAGLSSSAACPECGHAAGGSGSLE